MDSGMIERVARALVRARGAALIADSMHWPERVRHYREMCAEYPSYADAHSLITDAFRDARAAIAASGLEQLRAENKRLRSLLVSFSAQVVRSTCEAPSSLSLIDIDREFGRMRLVAVNVAAALAGARG